MVTNTKEVALEACIERYLTGGVSVMPPITTTWTGKFPVYPRNQPR